MSYDYGNGSVVPRGVNSHTIWDMNHQRYVVGVNFAVSADSTKMARFETFLNNVMDKHERPSMKLLVAAEVFRQLEEGGLFNAVT